MEVDIAKVRAENAEALHRMVACMGEEIVWEGRPDVRKWMRDGKWWMHMPFGFCLMGLTLLATIPFVNRAFDHWRAGDVPAAVLVGLGLPLGVYLAGKVMALMDRRRTRNAVMEDLRYFVTKVALYRAEVNRWSGKVERLERISFGRCQTAYMSRAYVFWPQVKVISFKDWSAPNRRMVLEGVNIALIAIRSGIARAKRREGLGCQTNIRSGHGEEA